MPTTARVLRCVRVVLAACAIIPMVAYAQEGRAGAGARLLSGTLSFVGHSTLGDFTGTTSSVTAEVLGDLASPHGWVEAPVASLRTANRLRDRDLRSSMEAERYPTLRYAFASAAADALSPARGDTVELRVQGTLTIHGVARVVEVPVAAVWSGDTIHVTAGFAMDLADYGIQDLTRAFGLLRMKREIEVRVELRLLRSGRGPGTEAELRDPAVRGQPDPRVHDAIAEAHLVQVHPVVTQLAPLHEHRP